jgi:light-regulated signal transduction histidine kinase (bacteriophytochrome)
LSESLCRQVADLLGITNATGVALIGADVLELSGITPDKETVQKLYSWLSHMEQESLFSSDRLSLDYPQWNEIAPCASGLLAINISGQKPLWILWFRPELIKEVLWAGNPHKPVEIKSNHADLHPRKSFELWKETVRRYCRPWLALEMEAADSMKREIFVLTLAEILRSEKTRKIIQQQREDVLSILAHDMNAPVAAMERILGDLLSDTGGRVPAQLRETLQVLETGNRQQLTRIRKLLRVLAYEVGTAAIDNTQIDCAEIIRQSIAEVVPLSDHGGAQIITTIKQDNGNFKSDPESIRRLVVNLVDNALRAAGSSGTVNVLCETIGTKLRIQIADNGPGIAVEDQEHLFERFWHGSVAKPYAPHVGMGLYLCKRIVDSLNGNISCESELGKGASFTVIVPTL